MWRTIVAVCGPWLLVSLTRASRRFDTGKHASVYLANLRRQCVRHCAYATFSSRPADARPHNLLSPR